MSPRERADAIRSRLAEIIAHRDTVLELIQQAKDADDAAALGYPSWTAYVSGEFGDLLPKLDRAERQPLVAQMRALGMSTRAIAPVVGVDQKTVVNDFRATEENSSVEFPDTVTSLDGRERPASRPVPSSAPTTDSHRKAWQPFRSLMSETTRRLIEGADDLIEHHDWTDLDEVHAHHGIDGRTVVLDRVRALHAATGRILAAWDDQPTSIRRIK